MSNSLDEEVAMMNVLSEKLLISEIVQPDEEHVFLDEDVQTTSWSKGERQPVKFRDSSFAIVFLAQVTVIVVVGMAWGLPALNNKGDDVPSTRTPHFAGALWIISWSFLTSIILSGVALLLMARFAENMLKFSVLYSIFSSLVLVVISLIQGYSGAAISASCTLLVACAYAWSVWDRLPFATANLVTALSAIQMNWGLLLIPYTFCIVTCGYSLLWILSLIGVYKHSNLKCDENGVCDSSLNKGIFILFLLAFFWTQQVIKNVIHVTVAGVVGSWWFVPEESNSGCSKSVTDSLARSMTSSLGSICMGSLLVSVVQVVHHLVTQAKGNGRRNDIVYCIAECLLNQLNKLIKYFNKWSYVYIGLYGYSYMEAGTKVMTLFKSRGWDAIINDQLVLRVLSLVSFVIGTITGLISVFIVQTHPSIISVFDDGDVVWVSFFCGLLMGTVVAGILMSVVASAVDTVVVLYAESPLDLHANYPFLSQQMVEAWSATYPQEYRLVTSSTLV
jgi:Plasma-membrane choline transporter